MIAALPRPSYHSRAQGDGGQRERDFYLDTLLLEPGNRGRKAALAVKYEGLLPSR